MLSDSDSNTSSTVSAISELEPIVETVARPTVVIPTVVIPTVTRSPSTVRSLFERLKRYFRGNRVSPVGVSPVVDNSIHLLVSKNKKSKIKKVKSKKSKNKKVKSKKSKKSKNKKVKSKNKKIKSKNKKKY
jgi:hypothetical protein